MAFLESRTSRVSDYLNNFRFHVLDVSMTKPIVFNLSFGFSYCTAPEISVETIEIKSGTFEFKKSVPVSASVGEVEFRQGARLFNSDFYDWCSSTIRGQTNIRRNLLVIQYSEVALFPGTGNRGLGATLLDIANVAIGLNDLLKRVPARAWMLYDCIPVYYKSGTDFDALGNDISMSELRVRPWHAIEYNMGI